MCNYRLPIFLRHFFLTTQRASLRLCFAPEEAGQLKPAPADSSSAGRMIAFILRGEKNEISCAKDAELRDNYFNFGGLAIWDGTGRMNRNDPFEAEASAAVSQAE
jgi:hypothetical protein